MRRLLLCLVAAAMPLAGAWAIDSDITFDSPEQEARWTQLREYASLLGEERGARKAQELSEASLGFAAAAPHMAKERVARAYGRMRSTKKFDKKDQSA